MIHLHVRKADNTYRLEVADYQPAVAAARRAVGDESVVRASGAAQEWLVALRS